MFGISQARASLHIDPSACASTPSPSSACTTLSSPLTTRPSPAGSPTTEDEDEKDPKSGRQKPKRCRVTPEQLVHLERFFTVEPSPTAARRRDISELLGMQERQTQIWFQNRRAKAKLQSNKLKKVKELYHGPEPHMPPSLSATLGTELNNLIHEEEAVTFIPCSDLSIGSWRRIATDTSQHDLIAYTCESKRSLNWFIHNGGIGFKMEVAFDSIIETEFTNLSASAGLATFVVSKPPLFFLETVSENGSPRSWKRCTDWTEGHQASHVLRHDLIGSAVPLIHLLQSLQPDTEAASPYSPHSRSEPTSPMEIPPPPLSIIQQVAPQSQQQPEDYIPIRPNNSFRRRSLADANDLSHIVVSGLSHYRRDLPHTAPPLSFTHTSYLPAPGYNPIASSPLVVEDNALEEYDALFPIPHLAQPVPRGLYDKSSPLFFSPYSNNECAVMEPGMLAQMYYGPNAEMAFAG
ncbi:homeodomain transcription factor [Roridomyces roridus]|uniref:Homeodomain transcription factor n=1 Tax=Roridomyces roridus TaxID=1738132 RepID=A0AAD7CJK1_9AGAR|nr:homeodomain transcription factor [Roridomyces roridus]